MGDEAGHPDDLIEEQGGPQPGAGATTAASSQAPFERSRASFLEARLRRVFEYLKGGAEGDRTPDLCIANAALSQLSYRPNRDAESSFCAVSVNRKTARGAGLGTVLGSLRAAFLCSRPQLGR